MQDYIAAPDLLGATPTKPAPAASKAAAGTKKAAANKPQASSGNAAAPAAKSDASLVSHMSMSEIKQALAAKCLLPVGSKYLSSR